MMAAMDALRALALPLAALLLIAWVLTRPNDPARRHGALTVALVVAAIGVSAFAIVVVLAGRG
jgi:hypothetical protein